MSRNAVAMARAVCLQTVVDKMSATYPAIVSQTDENLLDLVMSDACDQAKYCAKFIADIAKIQFDFENYSVEKVFCHNGAWIELCLAGGDWQYPIYFGVYWDGNDIRAYLPVIGNLFNHDTKEALGDADETMEQVRAFAEKSKWPFVIKDDVEEFYDIDGEEAAPIVEAFLIEQIKKRIVVTKSKWAE